MLVSTVQQHESAGSIQSSGPFWASFPLFHPTPPVFTEHWAELPVLQSSFPLAILHMVAHISNMILHIVAYRSNQSILKEMSPEYSLEGLMLKLKLQYFGHLMWRTDHRKRPWCWERLRAGGEGDDRGWDGWMASPTQWTWVWVNSGSWWWTGKTGVLQSMGSQRVGHDWVTELNWSSILAWRIPWIEEPGGLQSIRLQRVGHDWVTNTHTHPAICPAPCTVPGS